MAKPIYRRPSGHVLKRIDILGPVTFRIFDGTQERSISPRDDGPSSPYYLGPQELWCLQVLLAYDGDRIHQGRLADAIGGSQSRLAPVVSHVRSLTGIKLRFDRSDDTYQCSEKDLMAAGIACDAREFLRRGTTLISRRDAVQLHDLSEVLALWRGWRDGELVEILYPCFKIHREMFKRLTFMKADLLMSNTSISEDEHADQLERLLASFTDVGSAAEVEELRRRVRATRPLPLISKSPLVITQKASIDESALTNTAIAAPIDERTDWLLELTALFVALSQQADGSWGAGAESLMPESMQGSESAYRQSLTSWCALSLRDSLGARLNGVLDAAKNYFAMFHSEGIGAYGVPTKLPDGVVAVIPHFRFTASAAKFLLEVNGPTPTVSEAVRFLVRYAQSLGGWPEMDIPGASASVLTTTYVLDTLEKCRPHLKKLDAALPGAHLSLDVPIVIEKGLHWLATIQQDSGWKAKTGGSNELLVEELTAHVVGFLPQLFQRYPDYCLPLAEPLIRKALDGSTPQAEPSALGRVALYTFGAYRIDQARFAREISVGIQQCLNTVELLARSESPRPLDMAFVLLLNKLPPRQSNSSWSTSVLDRFEALRNCSPANWERVLGVEMSKSLRRWLQL